MATGDPTDDALVAAVFRAALSLGIATPADLVPWADAQILVRDRPAEWIIDLAIGAAVPAVPADGVALALREVASGIEPTTVFRLIVGLVDGADEWPAHATQSASRWLCNVVRRYSADPHIASYAMAIEDEVSFLDHHPNQKIAAELASLMPALFRKHADPAARAWLPGVRVTFG